MRERKIQKENERNKGVVTRTRRHTDRYTKTEIERETAKERDKQVHKERERETAKETQTGTQRERDRQTDCKRKWDKMVKGGTEIG